MTSINYKKNNAVTLIELLITVVVIAIVVPIGVKSIRTMVATNSVIAMTEKIAADISFAQTLSIEESRLVNMSALQRSSCESDPSSAGCNYGSDWNFGWVIYKANRWDGTAYNTASVKIDKIKFTTPNIEGVQVIQYFGKTINHPLYIDVGGIFRYPTLFVIKPRGTLCTSKSTSKIARVIVAKRNQSPIIYKTTCSEADTSYIAPQQALP